MNNQYRMHLVFAAVLALTQHWLLVSDLHVNPFVDGSTPVGYHDDTNWALFDSTVSAMRRAAPDARVVIIPGDFLAHKFGAKLAQSQVSLTASAAALRTMSRIERTFARAFPRAQFVIALGNNDDPCGDYQTAPETPYLSSLARIWAPLVNRANAAPDFVNSFSYAASYTARLPVHGLRAVVLDDVFWSVLYRPCGRVAGNPPLAQQKWLASTLGSAAPGTRDVVVAHIPPGVDPTSTLIAHRLLVVPFLADAMDARFRATLSAHAGDIAFAVTGHMHRGGFRIVGGVPTIVAASVSPNYGNNPEFARLEIDPDGTLKNYQLYAYSETAGSWTQTADFDRTYGASDFTVSQLRAVHDRIGADPALRGRWASAMVGGSDLSDQIRTSWRAYWCAQTAVGSSYVRCAGDQLRTAVVPIVFAVFAALALLILIVLVLRLARQRKAH